VNNYHTVFLAITYQLDQLVLSFRLLGRLLYLTYGQGQPNLLTNDSIHK